MLVAQYELEINAIGMKRNWVCIPIASMYGIFTYIYHENQPNVGKYTIHGSYGNESLRAFEKQQHWLESWSDFSLQRA